MASSSAVLRFQSALYSAHNIRIARCRRYNLLILSFICSTALSFAADATQNVASEPFNEFDLAGYCHGAQYRTDDGGQSFNQNSEKFDIPHSEFGYLTVGKAPDKFELAYISSQFHVETGPRGDPGDCTFKRHLYRIDGAGQFSAEELDKNRYAQIRNEFRANRKAHFSADASIRSAISGDSVGHCLFPIEWHQISGQGYTLFSISRDASIVDNVTPSYQEPASDDVSACNAWGERHLTNSAVTWNTFEYYQSKSGLLFVDSTKYHVGFALKPNVDFQCVKGADAFSHHLFVSKAFFDSQIRPKFEEILKKHLVAGKKTLLHNEAKSVNFIESSVINHEFSVLLANLAEQKGCK
jgi:hypothetical protein